MAACATIRHRMDLALRLIDTVDGRTIENTKAEFVTNLAGVRAISKDGGVYLFLNLDKEAFEMEIHVYGYEKRKVFIDFLGEEKVPIRDIYLLPQDNPIRDEILTLRGSLSGIEEIEAVSLDNANCCIKEFDAKKRIMSVLNQRNVRFYHVYYGLVNRKKTAYEKFEVEKEISPQELKCKNALKKEYFINQPISRIIFGQINENGDFVLKVSNDKNAVYIVKYVVAGETFYQTVDFHEDNPVLTAHEIVHKEKEETWEQLSSAEQS